MGMERMKELHPDKLRDYIYLEDIMILDIIKLNQPYTGLMNFRTEHFKMELAEICQNIKLTHDSIQTS